jgi:hypothetical protein
MRNQIQEPGPFRQYAESISLANAAVTLAFFGLYLLGPFGNPTANSILSTIGICCFVGWANVLAVRAVNTDAASALGRLRATSAHDALTSLAPNPDSLPTPPKNPNIHLIADVLDTEDPSSASTLRPLLAMRGETLDDVANYYVGASREKNTHLKWHERVAYTGLGLVFFSGITQIYASTLSDEEKETSKSLILAGAIIFALSFGLSSLYTIATSRRIAQLKTEADTANNLLRMAIGAALQKQINTLQTLEGPSVINPLPRISQTTPTPIGAELFSSPQASTVHIAGGSHNTFNIIVNSSPGTPALAANPDDPSSVVELKMV